jgi:hypothetical protein
MTNRERFEPASSRACGKHHNTHLFSMFVEFATSSWFDGAGSRAFVVLKGHSRLRDGREKERHI